MNLVKTKSSSLLLTRVGFYGTHITLFKKIVKLVALQITLKGQLRSLSNSYLRGDEDV